MAPRIYSGETKGNPKDGMPSCRLASAALKGQSIETQFTLVQMVMYALASTRSIGTILALEQTWRDA